MNFACFEQASKFDSFNVSIAIKNLFLRVMVTIDPHRSLLTVQYYELFEYLTSIYVFRGRRTLIEAVFQLTFMVYDLLAYHF